MEQASARPPGPMLHLPVAESGGLDGKEFSTGDPGRPLIDTGRATGFDRGDNPINFVSVDDVADLAVRALEDAELRGQTIEIGGPENLTMNEVVAVFARAAGRRGCGMCRWQ